MPQPQAPPQARVERDYRCRHCGRWLFKSDAGYGKVTITCPDRRCRRAQVILLSTLGSTVHA